MKRGRATQAPRGAWQKRGGLAVRLSALGLAAAACITIKPITVGQKTSLERQLMGPLEPFDEPQLLAASVRAAAAGSAGSGVSESRAFSSALEQQAIAARRRQLFNQDEIEALKRAGCLGETALAQLVVRPCAPGLAAVVAPSDGVLGARLAAEENADRRSIIDWALASDAVLTAQDQPQVVALYARLLWERGKTGDWFQQENGSWTRR